MDLHHYRHDAAAPRASRQPPAGALAITGPISHHSAAGGNASSSQHAGPAEDPQFSRWHLSWHHSNPAGASSRPPSTDRPEPIENHVARSLTTIGAAQDDPGQTAPPMPYPAPPAAAEPIQQHRTLTPPTSPSSAPTETPTSSNTITTSTKPEDRYHVPPKCPHGRRRTQCTSCFDLGTGGGSICVHRRRKGVCPTCKGLRRGSWAATTAPRRVGRPAGSGSRQRNEVSGGHSSGCEIPNPFSIELILRSGGKGHERRS
ncbi:hypothetical protein DFJ73DRAFT_781187 [Zopfochytrium polystomum]|nr:hypothetical protein DFJ73DRAFT_781187 [Zopfochytrium polystomum]